MSTIRFSDPRDASAKKAQVLTTKTLESLRRLGLSANDAASILGVPLAVFQLLKKGQRTVDGLNGEAERADALVRICLKLEQLLGTEETKWRSWLRRPFADLGQIPLEVMRQRDGVLEVATVLMTVKSMEDNS